MSAVILTSPAELREIVTAAVSDALADLAPPHAEALVDRAELARRLGVSTRALDRLRRDGLPELRVGDLPRWRWADVLAWLGAREAVSP